MYTEQHYMCAQVFAKNLLTYLCYKPHDIIKPQVHSGYKKTKALSIFTIVYNINYSHQPMHECTQTVTSIKLNPVVKQPVTRLSDIPISFICSLMCLTICLYFCLCPNHRKTKQHAGIKTHGWPL